MIAITGAGGFIGSHLTEMLVSRGEEVLALDLPRNVPQNLSGLAGPNLHYTSCDVKDLKRLSPALPLRVEKIVHLAGTVGVSSYIEDPLGTIDSIVLGTRNVLELALKRRLQVIYASTSEVFGKNPAVPWREEADRVLGDPSIDRWSYATSKALCEHLVNAVGRRSGLRTTIVRPFNVYGPRQRPSFVIPAAIKRSLNGVPPLLYDEGVQTRCFTFVSDLVDGVARCLDTDVAVNQTFNLGSQKESTIREAIETVLRVCGSTLKPEVVRTVEKFGERYEDIPRRVPDCSKAWNLLGWRAETSLEAGVSETVEWAKANPDWLRS